jgi:hypothetical protein
MRRVAFVSLLFLVSAATAFATPFTPLEWQGRSQRAAATGEGVGKLLTWNRDQARTSSMICSTAARRRRRSTSSSTSIAA